MTGEADRLDSVVDSFRRSIWIVVAGLVTWPDLTQADWLFRVDGRDVKTEAVPQSGSICSDVADNSF